MVPVQCVPLAYTVFSVTRNWVAAWWFYQEVMLWCGFFSLPSIKNKNNATMHKYTMAESLMQAIMSQFTRNNKFAQKGVSYIMTFLLHTLVKNVQPPWYTFFMQYCMQQKGHNVTYTFLGKFAIFITCDNFVCSLSIYCRHMLKRRN